MKKVLSICIALAPMHSHASDIDLALTTTFKVLVMLEARLQADIEQKSNAMDNAAELYSKCLSDIKGSETSQCDKIGEKHNKEYESYSRLKVAEQELTAMTNSVVSHASTLKNIDYNEKSYRSCLTVWPRDRCISEFVGLINGNAK